MSAPDIRPDDVFTIPGEDEDSSVPELLEEVMDLIGDDPEARGFVEVLKAEFDSATDEEKEWCDEDLEEVRTLVKSLRAVMGLQDTVTKMAAKSAAVDLGSRFGRRLGDREWVFTDDGLMDAVNSMQASAVRSFAKTLMSDAGGRVRLSDSQKDAVRDVAGAVLRALGGRWDE